jgi:DNA topoisomerase II
MHNILKIISDYLTKKEITHTKNSIKQNLTFLLNIKIQNPTFDSQTKETLTSNYYIDYFTLDNMEQLLLKEILAKTNIISNITQTLEAKEKNKAERNSLKFSKILNDVPKLTDASWAGTNKSDQCTLILTEGDSAKSLAISGLSIIGRDKFGIFPLKGKLLNVREATKKQIENNEEFQNLKKILGLYEKLDYESLYSENGKFLLRYRRVLLMCDQDYDGSHIKGLFINLISHFWPKLIKHDFIQEMITPIIKVNHGGKTFSFFSVNDFQKFVENKKNYTSKYYKGLGTNTTQEAKEYFNNLNKHIIQFKAENYEKDLNMINNVFSKFKVKERKDWLINTKVENIDFNQKTIGYSNFLNNEFILFSKYDNHRSIPSMIDGLKPGQRKVLFSCFKRKLINEVKVAQLSGYVSGNFIIKKQNIQDIYMVRHH